MSIELEPIDGTSGSPLLAKVMPVTAINGIISPLEPRGKPLDISFHADAPGLAAHFPNLSEGKFRVRLVREASVAA